MRTSFEKLALLLNQLKSIKLYEKSTEILESAHEPAQSADLFIIYLISLSHRIFFKLIIFILSRQNSMHQVGCF